MILPGYCQPSPLKKGGLNVEPGWKELAACAGWWTGDCRANASCDCISECPARGLGAAVSCGCLHCPPFSSLSLCPCLSCLPSRVSQCLLVAEKCSVFIIVPVSVLSVIPVSCLLSSTLGKEKTEPFSTRTPLPLSAQLSPCQAHSRAVLCAPLGGLPGMPPSWWLAGVFKGRFGRTVEGGGLSTWWGRVLRETGTKCLMLKEKVN